MCIRDRYDVPPFLDIDRYFQPGDATGHLSLCYDTVEGRHRIDYLPINGNDHHGYYVLVEKRVPAGFAAAEPKAIVIEETADIQLYGLENEPKYIYVTKEGENGVTIEGAELALYKAEIGRAHV